MGKMCVALEKARVAAAKRCVAAAKVSVAVARLRRAQEGVVKEAQVENMQTRQVHNRWRESLAGGVIPHHNFYVGVLVDFRGSIVSVVWLRVAATVVVVAFVDVTGRFYDALYTTDTGVATSVECSISARIAIISTCGQWSTSVWVAIMKFITCDIKIKVLK